MDIPLGTKSEKLASYEITCEINLIRISGTQPPNIVIREFYPWSTGK